MFGSRRLVLIVALVASTALAIVLGVTDPVGTPSYSGRFLVWNLFLAWIPLGCALWLPIVERRLSRGLIGLCWLAFLPNAPYLVTDLVHLTGGGRELWRHVLQFGVAAWTGMMLGVVSMRIVHIEIERRVGRTAGWALVVSAVGLCAVGVVIGRFQRWNSWDLLTRPTAVGASTLDWIRSPISDVRSTGVAVAVAAFFASAQMVT